MRWMLSLSDEIQKWSRYSSKERQLIIEKLQEEVKFLLKDVEEEVGV